MCACVSCGRLYLDRVIGTSSNNAQSLQKKSSLVIFTILFFQFLTLVHLSYHRYSLILLKIFFEVHILGMAGGELPTYLDFEVPHFEPSSLQIEFGTKDDPVPSEMFGLECGPADLDKFEALNCYNDRYRSPSDCSNWTHQGAAIPNDNIPIQGDIFLPHSDLISDFIVENFFIDDNTTPNVTEKDKACSSTCCPHTTTTTEPVKVSNDASARAARKCLQRIDPDHINEDEAADSDDILWEPDSENSTNNGEMHSDHVRRVTQRQAKPCSLNGSRTSRSSIANYTSDDKKNTPLTKEWLDQHGFFDKGMTEAARELGIGLTKLKAMCRELNISRWPYRHRYSMQKLKVQVLNDPEMNQEERSVALEDIEDCLHNHDGPTKVVAALRQRFFKRNHEMKKGCSSACNP